MNFLSHLEQQGIDDHLRVVLWTLATAVKDIAAMVGNNEYQGKIGTENTFGEQQIALDVAANNLLMDRLRATQMVATFSSEETAEEVALHPDGKLSVVTDPLDGSSLADVNFSVGTILGIYPGKKLLGRMPREQVAAMVGVYGPRTTIFCATGNGLHHYTYIGKQFLLTGERLRVEPDGKYFAPGNLKAVSKSAGYKKALEHWLRGQYKLRYSGGMVPDINHIFLKGKGIFTYPGYADEPDGKLRLLYECGPMAYLMEQAGGSASDGRINLLDKKIESYDQRTQIFIGSRKEVETVTPFFKA